MPAAAAGIWIFMSSTKTREIKPFQQRVLLDGFYGFQHQLNVPGKAIQPSIYTGREDFEYSTTDTKQYEERH